MTIIFGTQGSGKSTAATKMAMLGKSIYMLAENDARLMASLSSKRIEFFLERSFSIEDIKHACMERGGIISNDLEYCIVDSINMIKDEISYSDRIRKLMEIEKTFKIEIVATFNTLSSKKKDVCSALIGKIKSDIGGDARFYSSESILTDSSIAF